MTSCVMTANIWIQLSFLIFCTFNYAGGGAAFIPPLHPRIRQRTWIADGRIRHTYATDNNKNRDRSSNDGHDKDGFWQRLNKIIRNTEDDGTTDDESFRQQNKRKTEQKTEKIMKGKPSSSADNLIRNLWSELGTVDTRNDKRTDRKMPANTKQQPSFKQASRKAQARTRPADKVKEEEKGWFGSLFSAGSPRAPERVAKAKQTPGSNVVWTGLFPSVFNSSSQTESQTTFTTDEPKIGFGFFSSNSTSSKATDAQSSSSSSIWSFFKSGVSSSRISKSEQNERLTVKRLKEKGKNTTVKPLSTVQKLASSLSSSPSSLEQWVPIFPKTRIAPGERIPVTVQGIDLLVVASRDARTLYCIENSCPHLGTPLETGEIKRLPIESSPGSSGTNDWTSEPDPTYWTETEVSSILQQDGCEDCIVCPLHHTAFALASGQVRGAWCPYPPIIGKVMGTVQGPRPAAVFEVRTRGKNVEVRLNTALR